MKWLVVEKLNAEAFQRLTGVKRSTFEKMVEMLSQAQQAKQARGGR